MAFILLCIAVLLMAAPIPGAYKSWVAFSLALVALILGCLGGHIGHWQV